LTLVHGVTQADRRDDSGARAAFERWVVPEIDVLLGVALAAGAQPADAEDIVQETLLRAYRSIGTFDGRHPREWLLTILRNVTASRHRRRRPGLLAGDVDLDAYEVVGAVPLTPEDLVVGVVFDAMVEAALADLPSKYRSAVELVDVLGLSYAEAASGLGVPQGTVMSRVHRLRARIRQHLARAAVQVPGGER